MTIGDSMGKIQLKDAFQLALESVLTAQLL